MKLNEVSMKSVGFASTAMDTYFVYKFSKFMVTPWTEWEAYKLGIIDDKGNKLRKPTTNKEKENYTFFHRLVRKLKQNLEKVPGMKSKLGKAMTAYWLFREEVIMHGANGPMLDEALLEYCNSNLSLNESIQMKSLLANKMLIESIK